MVLTLATLPCIWFFVGLKVRWCVVSGKLVPTSGSLRSVRSRPAHARTQHKSVKIPPNSNVELGAQDFPAGPILISNISGPLGREEASQVGSFPRVDLVNSHTEATVQRCFPRYVSKTSNVRVHAKIHGLNPEQIPASFLADINRSLSCCKSQIVSVGVRASCIELVIDIQKQDSPLHTTATLLMSSQDNINSVCRCWGSDDGQLLLGSRSERVVSSDVIHAGAGQDIQAVSPVQLQTVDWLQLLQQHLPPPAEDAGFAQDSWASVSHTPQAPSQHDLNLEGVPCITQCSTVLLMPDSSPAASAVDMHVVVYSDINTTDPCAALTLTVRDTAHHLRIVQRMLPRQDDDAGEVSRFQVSFQNHGDLAEGLLIVECRAGVLLGNSWPVLVTSDPNVATEILSYAQHVRSDEEEVLASGHMSSFIFDIGTFMQYIHSVHPAAAAVDPATVMDSSQDSCDLTSQIKGHYLTPEHRTHIHTLAVGLLEHAIATDCIHLACTLVAGMHTSGCTLAWIEQQLADSGSQQSLLQLAHSTRSSVPVLMFSKWPTDEQACTEEEAFPGAQAFTEAQACTELQACTAAQACTAKFQDVGSSSPQPIHEKESSVQACRNSAVHLGDCTKSYAADQNQSAQGSAASAASRSGTRPLGLARRLHVPIPASTIPASTTLSSSHASSSVSSSSITGTERNFKQAQNKAYLLWLGQRTLVYTHLWSILNMLMVMGILLRMSWKGRMMEDGLVLMVYTTLRAAYVLMLTFTPQTYVENREAFNECLAAARMMVKVCACFGGHFCCPPAATGYMMRIDWAIDCVMPTVCEQVWSSNSVGLRIVEALITYQLYTLFGIKALTAAIIAIIWNGACILLAFLLDSHNRHVFAAVQAATGKKKRASNTNR